jgi:hypothetical protein
VCRVYKLRTGGEPFRSHSQHERGHFKRVNVAPLAILSRHDQAFPLCCAAFRRELARLRRPFPLV